MPIEPLLTLVSKAFLSLNVVLEVTISVISTKECYPVKVDK